MARAFLLTTLVSLLLSPFAFAGDGRKGLKMIDGIWQSTSAEMSGKTMPDAVVKTMKLELKDGKYTVGNDSGTVSVDPGKKPKEMEVKGVQGPNKGKTFLCIYELDGDTMRICYDLSGKSRPKEFKTTEGTQLFLVTYKRKKP
jgi:uncharacterized protein (TIGR03067 family)